MDTSYLAQLTDMFGHPLAEGDFILFTESPGEIRRTLSIGRILRVDYEEDTLGRTLVKRARIEYIHRQYIWGGKPRYLSRINFHDEVIYLSYKDVMTRLDELENHLSEVFKHESAAERQRNTLICAVQEAKQLVSSPTH